MDRGYLDFTRLYTLHQSGGFFVTRAKRNLNAQRVHSKPVDRSTGLICDQSVTLNNFRGSCAASATKTRKPRSRSRS